VAYCAGNEAEVGSVMDANWIVVGGFSQSGVMALLTGLTSEFNMDEAVGLSGWLPLRHKLAAVSVLVDCMCNWRWLNCTPRMPRYSGATGSKTPSWVSSSDRHLYVLSTQQWLRSTHITRWLTL
jgi:hypothetical protein